MFFVARDRLGEMTGGESLAIRRGVGWGVGATLHRLGVVPRHGGGVVSKNIMPIVSHITSLCQPDVHWIFSVPDSKGWYIYNIICKFKSNLNFPLMSWSSPHIWYVELCLINSCLWNHIIYVMLISMHYWCANILTTSVFSLNLRKLNLTKMVPYQRADTQIILAPYQ